MSTTVTYKGSTLTTVNNQTRTLQTSGKWMEDDLTLVDANSGIDGNNLGYGLTDGTLPIVGVAKVGSAEI